jgi:hypothetical protein
MHIAYFDTNVVRDLSENRIPEAKKNIAIIRGSIEGGNLILAPSFEVLYELLSSPDLSDKDQIANAQFYDSLVNWKYALKPSNKVLPDDIDSWVRGGGPVSPYRGIDENSGFIQSIRKGEHVLPPRDWARTIKRTNVQNQRFVKTVFSEFVKRMPSKSRRQVKEAPGKIWNKWWSFGGLADVLADSLASGKVSSSRCSLLAFPTIRTAVGYILHTWQHQICTGAKLKPTAHYDFRNATIAGGVGTIVTEDKNLRNAIKHVPELPVKPYALREIIDTIESK